MGAGHRWVWAGRDTQPNGAVARVCESPFESEDTEQTKKGCSHCRVSKGKGRGSW